MNTSIVLDQPGNVSFTNLDEISGKVVLRTTKTSDIDRIIVKLEGESRTRLLSTPVPTKKSDTAPKAQLEYHKILYKVQMVFPDPHLQRARQDATTKSSTTYTVSPGTNEYPFSFKFPFNNQCSSDKGQMGNMTFGSSGLQVTRPPREHVKKTLPPTLSGFPGEAEIRYYVKVTVQRHSFFKENPRVYMPFNFFPIEPPRAPVNGAEVYARQKHSFGPFPEDEKGKSRMKSIFGKSKEPSSSVVSSDAPYISVDARLPEPAILTCNEDIPLKLIVKKLNENNSMIYLQSLQISLIGTTKIRAHEVFRTESNSWIIMSKSNMGVPVGAASDPVDTETRLDDGMWRGQKLPNTVAPSFQTCNIERTYSLDIRIGLSYSGAMAKDSKPQTIVLPLRLNTEVYSGIAPPPELLNAMAEARVNIRQPSYASAMQEKMKMEGRKDSTSSVPPTPIDENAAMADHANFPAQPGTSGNPDAMGYVDAPPSYEDAIATNLPPVDAEGRPAYAPPPPEEDDILNRDEKKGFGRRDS